MFSQVSVCPGGGVGYLLFPGSCQVTGPMSFLGGGVPRGYCIVGEEVEAIAAVGTHPSVMLSCLDFI